MAFVLHDDKALTDAVEAVNTWLTARVTYDWNGTGIKWYRDYIGFRVVKRMDFLEK